MPHQPKHIKKDFGKTISITWQYVELIQSVIIVQIPVLFFDGANQAGVELLLGPQGLVQRAVLHLQVSQQGQDLGREGGTGQRSDATQSVAIQGSYSLCMQWELF